MPIRLWHQVSATATLPFSLRPERVKPWLMPEVSPAGKGDVAGRARVA
jgi:hypothetical protein